MANSVEYLVLEHFSLGQIMTISTSEFVEPSSGTAERVFTLTKMLFSDRQESLLFDAMKEILFNAYNKR